MSESDLSPEGKRKLETLKGLFTKSVFRADIITGLKSWQNVQSELANNYYRWSATYDDANLKYASRKIDAQSGTNPDAMSDWTRNEKKYTAERDAVMADWITKGYKNEFEKVMNYVEHLQSGKELDVSIDELMKRCGELERLLTAEAAKHPNPVFG